MKVKYEDIFFIHTIYSVREDDTKVIYFNSFIVLHNIGQNMYEGTCYNQAILLGNMMEVSMHEFQCIFIPLLLCKIS